MNPRQPRQKEEQGQLSDRIRNAIRREVGTVFQDFRHPERVAEQRGKSEFLKPPAPVPVVPPTPPEPAPEDKAQVLLESSDYRETRRVLFERYGVDNAVELLAHWRAHGLVDLSYTDSLRLEFLREFQTAVSADLSGLGGTDWAFLGEFPRLEELSLRETKPLLADVRLADTLRVLDVSHCGLDSLVSLPVGTDVVTLLARGGIPSLEGIERFTALERFDCTLEETDGRRFLERIEGGETVRNLSVFAAQYLRTRHLGDLRGAKNLLLLYLADGHMESLEGLEEATGLVTLAVDGNEIADLAPIRGCKSLRYLSVRNNCLGPEALTVLRDLDLYELEIEGNSGLEGSGEIEELRRLCVQRKERAESAGII